jgi:hypothetical protein
LPCAAWETRRDATGQKINVNENRAVGHVAPRAERVLSSFIFAPPSPRRQDDVAVALARLARGAEFVPPPALEPDIDELLAVAVFVERLIEDGGGRGACGVWLKSDGVGR